MAEAVADQLQQTTLDGSINHTASERASLSQQEAGAEPTGVAPESEAHEVTVRALVSSKAAGIIIGRAGQAVAEVRSQTGVKAGVSKTVPGVVDRILSITGTPDAISEVNKLLPFHEASPVLKLTRPCASPIQALRMISTTLADSLANDLQAPPTPASINFLIPHAAMGALIGKSGARIKEIQDGSGSRMVAHKDMLPQSTERIVEISGTPEGIAIAAKSVAETLQAEADKLHGSVLFHPQAIGPEGPAQIGQPMSFGGNLSVLGGYQSSAGRGGRGGRRGVSSSGFGSRAMPGGHARLSSSSFGASQTAAPFAVQSAAMPAPLFNPDDPTLRTQHISFPADSQDLFHSLYLHADI